MFGRLPPALVLTLAIVAGASMDATIKHLVQTNHVLLVAFGRYLIWCAVFSLLIWWRAGHSRHQQKRCGARTVVRGFVIAACAVDLLLGALESCRLPKRSRSHSSTRCSRRSLHGLF